jgi:hypothetical protein
MGMQLYNIYYRLLILLLVLMTSLKDQISGCFPRSSIKSGCFANWNILETIVRILCNDIGNARLFWTRILEETGSDMWIGLNWLRKGSLAGLVDHCMEPYSSAKGRICLFPDQNIIVFWIANPLSLVENYQLFSHFLTSLETVIFSRMRRFRGIWKSESTNTHTRIL